MLSLGWRERAHRATRDEWHLIEGLAQRIALTVDGAQQYRERAHLAQTLQASLIPEALPGIPGTTVAGSTWRRARASTWAATSTTSSRRRRRVGRSSSATSLGKGPEAAVVTALARYTLRALARPLAVAGGTLALLNERCCAAGPGRLLSAVLARVEPPDGGARSCGQRRPPAARAAARRRQAEAVACPGPLLGVDGRAGG